MPHFLLWTVPWLNLYVDNVWVHGNDQTLYICINYLYLLNTIQWILVKVPRAQTHRHAQCFPVWRIVVIYYLVCFRLLHCTWIFPNSKEKHIAYVQISVDQYLLNDMQQILINNIKIYMNVRCAAMTSSKIANLTMLVEIRNAKTFYQKNM
jgi:hypothetical protein